MSRLKEIIKFYLQNPIRLFVVPITWLPYFKFIRDTRDYQSGINFDIWFKQKILNLGGNRDAYWPVHWTSKVYNSNKVLVGIDAYPGIMNGCYIQGIGGIKIGDYTQIAPNVVIVSANHDVYDTRIHIEKPVIIGKYCWLGAGSKIMPGVVLGDFTIVGAGAVVTKSFPDGYCILGGVPADVIRNLDREKCILYSHEKLYNGYIPHSKFEEFRAKRLHV